MAWRILCLTRHGTLDRTRRSGHTSSSSMVELRASNPKVRGSNPRSLTSESCGPCRNESSLFPLASARGERRGSRKILAVLSWKFGGLLAES